MEKLAQQSDEWFEWVPIDEIQLYSHNPRRILNPEYDRIKESLRVHGLTQPLVVTKRPGAGKYELHSGGNTRLQILKDLCGSGNTKIPCVIKDWQGDIDALLAHLRENELHGQLTFIEKARAVSKAIEFIRGSRPQKNTSQRDLARIFGEFGYPISQSLLSHMQYTAKHLQESLPEALQAGLGKSLVVKIRGLERSAAEIWNEHTDDETDFEGLFPMLCSRCDGPDFDFNQLQNAVSYEIAQASDLDQGMVNLLLDDVSHDRSLALDKTRKHDRHMLPSDANAESIPTSNDSQMNVLKELTRLRRNAHKQAIQLAAPADLSHQIAPLEHIGYGFIVCSLPTTKSSAQTQVIFELLLCSSGEMALDKKKLSTYLPKEANLHAQLSNNHVADMWSKRPTPCLNDCLNTAATEFDDVAWRTLLKLLQIRRRLTQLGLKYNVDLWEKIGC